MTDTPARVAPPTPEQIEARQAAEAALIERLAGATTVLDKITTIYAYDLPEPVRAGPGLPHRVITRITVSVTRYPGRSGLDPKRLGKITVTGWHSRRNATGRPRANGSRPTVLPIELAADLITRALTQS